MTRRFMSGVALVLAVAAAVHAETIEELLTAKLREVRAANVEPARGFVGVLADMPDFSLTSTQIRRAAERAGVELDEMVRGLFGKFERISKRGDEVTVKSPDDQEIEFTNDETGKKGYLELSEEASMTIRRRGDAIELRDFDGVEAGNGTFMATVKEITFTANRDGGTHIVAKAKWGFINKTIEKDLPPPPPPPAPAGTPGEPAGGDLASSSERAGAGNGAAAVGLSEVLRRRIGP